MKNYAALTTMFLSLAACSNDLKFNGAETTAAKSTTLPTIQPAIQPTGVAAVPAAGLLVYETKSDFQTTSHVALDLVWVIDDSGSMKDDIDRVKANFHAFTNSLQAISDFKMALITQKQAPDRDNPNSVDLSSLVTGANFLQIDTMIDSHNALAITGAALCPDRQGACGQAKISAAPNQVVGSLLNFLRPNSKKAFIFVTDDNANISADQFIGAFKRSYPNQNPSTYAFIGLGGSASPCQAATGSNYQELVSKTGGAYFNICNADWTSTYGGIIGNIAQLAQNSIQLPSNIAIGKIVKVAINGVVVDPSRYTITGDGIVFDSSVLTRGVVSTVSVYYNP